ncbi:MAG TPA: hypothetical protein VM577_19165 [Anaerovoracaceae bacterium]|nr:hypothetical protein [Anaerovoracaceae bacterium]
MELWKLQERVDAIDEYEINSFFFADLYKCFSSVSVQRKRKIKLNILSQTLSEADYYSYGYEVAQFFVDWLDDPEDEDVFTQKDVFDLLTADGLDEVQRLNAKLTLCSMTMLMSSVGFINILTSSDFWGLVAHGSIQNDREFAVLYCAEMLSQSRSNARPISEMRPNVSNIICYFDTEKSEVQRSLMALHEKLSNMVDAFNEFMPTRFEIDAELSYLMVATVGRLATLTKRESLNALWDKLDNRRGEYLGEFMTICLKTLKANNLPFPLFDDNLEEYFNMVREKGRLEGGVAQGKESSNNGRI